MEKYTQNLMIPSKLQEAMCHLSNCQLPVFISRV